MWSFTCREMYCRVNSRDYYRNSQQGFLFTSAPLSSSARTTSIFRPIAAAIYRGG